MKKETHIKYRKELFLNNKNVKTAKRAFKKKGFRVIKLVDAISKTCAYSKEPLNSKEVACLKGRIYTLKQFSELNKRAYNLSLADNFKLIEDVNKFWEQFSNEKGI